MYMGYTKESIMNYIMSETGKPLAYVEDDEVLQSIINHVIEGEERKEALELRIKR